MHIKSMHSMFQSLTALAMVAWRIHCARSPQVAWKVKWLSEKSDCLTVRFGEGYCRD